MPYPRELITPTLRQDMTAARDAALGPREDRTAEKAFFDPISCRWQGGVEWERSELAVPVNSKSPRCYTLAQSYQYARNLTGPTVGAKVKGQLLTHHSLRNTLITVCL